MSELQRLRARRPREVGYARVLAIAAVVLWLPVVGAFLPVDGSSVQGLFALLAIGHVFGSFGVVKGRSAGRILSAVTLGGLYLLLLPYTVAGFSDPDELYPELTGALGIVAALVAGAGVVLQFRPAVTAYVNAVTAALR